MRIGSKPVSVDIEGVMTGINLAMEDWTRPTHGMGEAIPDRHGLFRIRPKCLVSYDGTIELECVDARKSSNDDAFVVRAIGDPEEHECGGQCIEVSLWYSEVVELVAYAQQWLKTHDPDKPQIRIREESQP
jgi:hypothetical protein